MFSCTVCQLITPHSRFYNRFLSIDTPRFGARHRVQHSKCCSREHPRHDELPDGHQQQDRYREDDARNLRHRDTA